MLSNTTLICFGISVAHLTRASSYDENRKHRTCHLGFQPLYLYSVSHLVLDCGGLCCVVLGLCIQLSWHGFQAIVHPAPQKYTKLFGIATTGRVQTNLASTVVRDGHARTQRSSRGSGDLVPDTRGDNALTPLRFLKSGYRRVMA